MGFTAQKLTSSDGWIYNSKYTQCDRETSAAESPGVSDTTGIWIIGPLRDNQMRIGTRCITELLTASLRLLADPENAVCKC